jgi:hypothetical protein
LNVLPHLFHSFCHQTRIFRLLFPHKAPFSSQ